VRVAPSAEPSRSPLAKHALSTLEFCQEGVLAQREGGPPRRARLLAVGVGEQRSRAGDAIDVRGAVGHDAVVVGADVVHADVITPDNENVGFPAGWACVEGGPSRRSRSSPPTMAPTAAAAIAPLAAAMNLRRSVVTLSPRSTASCEGSIRATPHQPIA
jgi:hypothetical protein